jgi:glutathione S-transferase
MLTLCGFGISNYYNKVKLALLEKEIPFQEEFVWMGHAAVAAGSPLGKVPFLKTEQGILCESSVMLEYLEAAYPENPLLPKEPYAQAKVRELIQFAELYLELPARELYGEAFFEGQVSEEVKTVAAARLRKAIPAFMGLARFSPYIAGDTLSLADCAIVFHLRVVGLATQKIYGENFLTDPNIEQYLALMSERPTMVKIQADYQIAREKIQQLRAKK